MTTPNSSKTIFVMHYSIGAFNSTKGTVIVSATSHKEAWPLAEAVIIAKADGQPYSMSFKPFNKPT